MCGGTKSAVRRRSKRAAYQASARSRASRSRLGRHSSFCAHHDCQSHTTATSATVRVPRISSSAATSAPSETTSRQIRLSVPACGTIAEWNFSAPEREARHWKNIAPSEPRAMWARELRVISPGRLAMPRGCQLTPLVECSSSSHGSPPATERVRSAAIDRLTWLRSSSATR